MGALSSPLTMRPFVGGFVNADRASLNRWCGSGARPVGREACGGGQGGRRARLQEVVSESWQKREHTPR
eukprot:5181932-Pyramimonas_sp.AAC.1